MSDYEYSASDVDQYEKIIADLEREVERLREENHDPECDCRNCGYWRKHVGILKKAHLAQTRLLTESARAEGRREGLEDAAKLIEERIGDVMVLHQEYNPLEHHNAGCRAHAAAIRALDGEKGK